MKKISIIIPAFNEEKNLSVIHERLRAVFLGFPKYAYEIIFVNDGSTDDTQQNLEELAKECNEVKFIELSRNFGHQIALKAGLDAAKGDAVISMDADLQHPPEIIPQMIAQWEEGYDVVFTVRKYPKEISIFKRFSSNVFYRFISCISDIDFEKGAGSDFRLVDQSVLAVIRNMNEETPFLRGLFKWVGFKQIGVEFTAEERLSGASKYSFGKMMKFAVSGVTAFSEKPLHIATYLGFFFTVFAVVFYTVDVVTSLVNGTAISGWSSLIMTVVFFGGMQLMILGIIGIYIGKIFRQVKERPSYIIRNKNF